MAHVYKILMIGFYNNNIFKVIRARHQNSYHKQCVFIALIAYLVIALVTKINLIYLMDIQETIVNKSGRYFF